MVFTTLSRNGVPVRLTNERWTHIVDAHREMADLHSAVLSGISNPDKVLAGKHGALLAIRGVEARKFLVVVYRERDSSDGFVITAFVTRRLAALSRRRQLWPPEN